MLDEKRVEKINAVINGLRRYIGGEDEFRETIRRLYRNPVMVEVEIAVCMYLHGLEECRRRYVEAFRNAAGVSVEKAERIVDEAILSAYRIMTRVLTYAVEQRGGGGA